jgi:hypothetical protein
MPIVPKAMLFAAAIGESFCTIRVEKKPLIGLIEIIVTARKEFEDGGNESSVRRMEAAAEALALRLEVTTTAAMAFSYVFYEASWGRLPSREGVTNFLPPCTNMVNRLECLWVLLDKGLIKAYRPARNPVRLFYVEQEVAANTLANKSPSGEQTLFKVNEHSTRRITAVASEGGEDFLLMLDDIQKGYILKKPEGKGYDTYWLGKLVLEEDDIRTIIETLNEMLEQNRLPESQK